MLMLQALRSLIKKFSDAVFKILWELTQLRRYQLSKKI